MMNRTQELGAWPVESRRGFWRIMLAAALLLSSAYLSTRAQDISGGAGEGVKRPAESTPRRRTRSTTSSKPAKRTSRASSNGSSQPKVDLSKQVDAALELGNTARDGKPPRYEDAERAYQLAAQLDPQDARAYVGLGNTYFDQKRYTEAETAFRHATELDAEDPDAFIALAYTNNAQEHYADAEKAAQRALALDRNSYAAHAAIGWSHYRRKNYTEAEAAYRRALAISPKTPELYSELSLVLMEQGRWKESEPLLRQAVALEPSDTVALSDYGVVLHKLGQLEQAAQTYSEVSKLDPKLFAPHSNLALIKYTLGDFKQAREEWETAVRLNSDYALDRAGLLILDRKLTEARAELEKYTQANASDEDGWLLLGDVQRMQGDEAASRTTYARAAQLAPDYARHARPTVPAPAVAKASPTPEAVANVVAPTAQTVAESKEAEPANKEPKLLYASSVRNLKATNITRPTPATGVISVTTNANA
ncbi:MAG: tetratricopeptide repeat protein, partial [Acidobacteria bacterium]|nr:tetratricopeptide repeat protein [Acidobacteriota bacterium]